MKLVHWIPAIILAILIFHTSQQSRPAGADLGPDYLLHFLGYGAFALAIVWGRTEGLKKALTRRAAFTCWLLATGYGATDEFHQSFIPGRTATFWDFLADSAGAFVAVLIAYALLRSFSRPLR